jgi:serine/threonine protein kinase
MPLSPGDKVDRYEVLAFLSSGGMGEVYRARDPRLRRDIALKIVRIDASTGSQGSARLLREARAAAALSHPSIVAVHDVGEIIEQGSLERRAYIAMELVVGRPLRAYVGDASVPLERRVSWLLDIARALASAHAAGIVHRDVKPENVMVRAAGGVKVLDFGIARRQTPALAADAAHVEVDALTGEGIVLGTPRYMSPEQLRGDAVDERTDQFSWAVMAYELLAGSHPWRKREAVHTVAEILVVEPVPLDAVARDVPTSVARVVERALSKDPARRFSTMEALVAALGGRERVPEVQPDPRAVSPSTATAPSPAADTETAHTRTGGRSTRRPGTPRRFRTFALVGVALLAGGAVLGLRARGHSPKSAATTASLVAGATECATNADCARSHGGGAWHCHSQRHACVEVASPDCKAYAEPTDPGVNDVVWLGGMFPLSTDPGLISEMRAAELAREDFAQALGPSASRAGNFHARPIALVVCDEGVDPQRAAKHLVEDVEVPAIIGFRSTSSALNVIATELLPNHVLSLVSISQAPAVTRIPEPADEPRLVWRSTLDRDDCVRPLAALVSDVLEPKARSAGLGTRPLKVATVWAKAASHDMVEALFGALRFNGKSALDNGPNFRQFVFENDDASNGSLVSSLLTFAPNVIFFAEEAFVSKVIPPLEEQWRGPLRPTYLTESGLSSSATFAGNDAARRHRFFAATNVSTTMTNADLVLRYNMAFPREPIIRTEAPQPSYDAFYLLAYATYALGDERVTGPALSRAFERLSSPGRRVDVGPGSIYDAFGALRAGDPIDLVGAIGSLDFDRATGEAPIDYAIVCLGTDDTGASSSSVDSGLVYDATTKKLSGVLRCP